MANLHLQIKAGKAIVSQDGAEKELPLPTIFTDCANHLQDAQALLKIMQSNNVLLEAFHSTFKDWFVSWRDHNRLKEEGKSVLDVTDEHSLSWKPKRQDVPQQKSKVNKERTGAEILIALAQCGHDLNNLATLSQSELEDLIKSENI